MRILVAEDDHLSRLMMQRMLQTFGYEVILAADGRRAVEILSEPDGPRLALVDWMMPELDGVELCREIRSHRDGSYIYILLLTSKQNSEDIVAGLEAGADDYITKPCQPAELKARLHTGRRILSLEQKLIDAREEMRFQATRDGLTGLWNRSSILTRASSELQRSLTHGRPFSLLLCDIDHFKAINDTHGHLVGDLVLKEVADRLSSAVRPYDAVGRYGGEEFLIVLRDYEHTALADRADQIRSKVASTPVRFQNGELSVSVSIGAVHNTGVQSDLPLEKLLARADAALYRAKREGRNRSVVALSALSTPVLCN
jgi:diguanylate cyclase (GGDEF)-like protein